MQLLPYRFFHNTAEFVREGMESEGNLPYSFLNPRRSENSTTLPPALRSGGHLSPSDGEVVPRARPQGHVVGTPYHGILFFINDPLFILRNVLIFFEDAITCYNGTLT